MKNNYNSNTHIGTQPIRVLCYNIIYSFENFYDSFSEDLKEIIKEKGLEKQIKYLDKEEKIKDLVFVQIDKKIVIEESFLSYLWIICYSLIVIIDEKIQKPQNGIESPRKKEIISKAEKLFKYGMSLINRFSNWSLDLPNPERYEEDDEFYIIKTNSIFLNAINFILLHELSHVSLGHLDNPFKKGERTTDEILKDEYQADANAINYFIKGIERSMNKLDKKVGIIAGLCSLMFFSNNLKGINHPDPNERLKIGLEKINIGEDDIIWGIAAIGFHLWAITKGYRTNIPSVVKTYKNWFIEIEKEINKIKTKANEG